MEPDAVRRVGYVEFVVAPGEEVEPQMNANERKCRLKLHLVRINPAAAWARHLRSLRFHFSACPRTRWIGGDGIGVFRLPEKA
jgi:hypothetical protein